MFSAVKNSLISNEVVSFQETPWMSALRSWFFHTTFKMLENGSQTVVKCLNLIYTSFQILGFFSRFHMLNGQHI